MNDTQTTTSFCQWLEDLRMDPVYFVYRMYDENDALLYVGCTANLRLRLKDHYRTKPWIEQVSRIDLALDRNKAMALQVESKALMEEYPLFNAGYGPRPMLEGSLEAGLWLLFEALDEVHREAGYQ